MDQIYLYWLIILITLIFLIYLTLSLAFSVPDDELDPMVWLFQHRKLPMLGYGLLITILIVMLILLFLSPSRIPFEPPLSPAGLLTLSTTILLFSNFFVVKTPERPRTFDSHPLILYTAILFVSLAFLTGGIFSLRRSNRSIFDNYCDCDDFTPL